MSHRKKLPDFLIVGAMKSGTTTLFTDLAAHPRIFGPERKEPSALKDDHIRRPHALRQYEALFDKAAPDQITFEASTRYTQLPQVTGVPERARDILGSDLRVIYVVREPIARIISHHHHMMSAGHVGSDIDRLVHTNNRLIAYTSYGYQIRPWIDALGEDHVLVMRFDELVALRRDFVSCVESFVGVEPRPDLVDESRVENRSVGKPVPNRFLDTVKRSALYRRIKPLKFRMPRSTRQMIKSLAHTTTDIQAVLPSDETAEFIYDTLESDLAELGAILRHPHGGPAPVWSRRESLDTLQRRRQRAEADTKREPA